MREQYDSFADRQRDTYSALRVNTGHLILTIKEADPRVAIAETGVMRSRISLCGKILRRCF
jgi:hypothetical protein